MMCMRSSWARLSCDAVACAYDLCAIVVGFCVWFSGDCVTPTMCVRSSLACFCVVLMLLCNVYQVGVRAIVVHCVFVCVVILRGGCICL